MKQLKSRVRLFSCLASASLALLLTGCMISFGHPGQSRAQAAPAESSKMSTAPADAPAPVYYDIRAFGAVGDGITTATQAINNAIDAAAAAGGGTVLFPVGKWLSGTIRMKSNIHLYFAQGATLVAARWQSGAYDAIEEFPGTAYQDGGHTYFRNSLIYGENLENLTFSGPGLIDGTGLSNGDGPQDRISGFSDWQNHENARKEPYQPDRRGNKAFGLKLCRNIIMRDFTIYRGGHFAILATGCDGMLVDNVTMDTNRDGIDIDCCRNVTISNCRVNSPADDGICPKSSFALGRKVITENVTITNCLVTGYEVGSLLDGTMRLRPRPNPNGRIKFGTEANGGFRNITISNSVFRNCRGIALEEVDGGILENVTIDNITMMDCWTSPLYIRLGRRNRGPVETMTSSTLRNIIISNMIVHTTGTNQQGEIDPNSGIMIMGIQQKSIENVRLSNIKLIYHGGGTKEQGEMIVPQEERDERAYPEPPRSGIPSYGIYARHVNGLELADITMEFINPEMRPAIVADNVDGLEIDNVKAQTGQGVTPTKFTNVRNLVVRDSPSLKIQPRR